MFNISKQVKPLDKKLDSSFIYPCYGKAHEYHSCVAEDICCMYNSLPCFQVRAINPLISILTNSLILNSKRDTEKDKCSVGGAEVTPLGRVNSSPRELYRAQPELSEAVTTYVFGGVCP